MGLRPRLSGDCYTYLGGWGGVAVLNVYKLLLVDLDGVVWRGSRLLRENIEWLRRARSSGISVVFVSNNSTRSRRVYAERLTRIMGFEVGIEDIVTSGYAVARWLRETSGPSRVLVVGEEGLVEELLQQGHWVLSIGDGARCPVDYVVVGLDRNLTYARLRAAHRAIRQCGARLVAANDDASVPVENGDEPGAGAVLAALERSTGVKAAFIAGKPNPYMYELVLKQRGVEPRQALVIGDRCDTDIAAAEKLGIDSVLVLTGVAGERGERCKATYVVDTLADLDQY
ncbi:hypothetical protein Pdsh_03200 [Pyrodictium delaneyi]|uniref:Uncharacterized protein n=1 Tax=Pyrodictium delaneyi TaxID=1273541 RepID=A0A211YNX7_9CREN|nr:hypothetical protein Pdsh_03200 [Pyrodictium delaneyi]